MNNPLSAYDIFSADFRHSYIRQSFGYSQKEIDENYKPYGDDTCYRVNWVGDFEHIIVCRIEKRTPCGYWVNEFPEIPDFKAKLRFCRNNAKKKFAYTSLEEARLALYYRKLKQVDILEQKLMVSKMELNQSKQKLSELGILP